MTFPEVYYTTIKKLVNLPVSEVAPRGVPIARELICPQLSMTLVRNGVWVFSCPTHRVVPMRFILAELAHILAGRNDVESIATYNKTMLQYADDGKIMEGAYGYRLQRQLLRIIERLKLDLSTRQACATIFQPRDCITTRTHIPCNVFLQFLVRSGVLYLHVISRSSDAVTGFSIDTIHWQALLAMMVNELDTTTEVTSAQLIYSITSLHLYQSDAHIVNQWLCGDVHGASYELQFTENLSTVMKDCVREFTGGMTTRQLGELLRLDHGSIDTAEWLQEMFVANRNNVKR